MDISGLKKEKESSKTSLRAPRGKNEKLSKKRVNLILDLISGLKKETSIQRPPCEYQETRVRNSHKKNLLALDFIGGSSKRVSVKLQEKPSPSQNFIYFFLFLYSNPSHGTFAHQTLNTYILFIYLFLQTS